MLFRKMFQVKYMAKGKKNIQSESKGRWMKTLVKGDKDDVKWKLI